MVQDEDIIRSGLLFSLFYFIVYTLVLIFGIGRCVLCPGVVLNPDGNLLPYDAHLRQ